jgi:glucose-1-phosphate thymidylyltransferase
MLPIANQPILFYGLRHLAQAGIKDVAIILGPIQEGIREGIGDGGEFGLHVEYINQGEPKGLAHAVLCAEKFLGSDSFVMYLGDNLLQSGVSPFVNRYQDSHFDAVVGVTPVSNPQNFGVVETDGDQILSIEEKPSAPKGNLALIGVYLFTPSIHPIIRELAPSKRGELEITDAIWKLWKKTGKVSVLRVDGWWKDTGHPDDLLEANELVLKGMSPQDFRIEGTIEPGAEVEGSVGIGSRTVIEQGAHLIGPSIIGSDARISRGSRVGPYCAIGNQVSVSRSHIRRSIVLDRAHIDGVRLADSLVGRNVEIRAKHPFAKDIVLMLGDSSKVAL